MSHFVSVPVPSAHIRGLAALVCLVFTLVLAAADAVHGQQTDSPVPHYDNETLPEPVLDMRAAILDAASTGRIEEMRVPLELNELVPAVGDTDIPLGDPIKVWKKLAPATEGREILARAINVLEMRPARGDTAAGGGALYVWPYLAMRDLTRLGPAERVDLLRLVPVEKAVAMLSSGTYTYDRIHIGDDGTWHAFITAE